MVEKAGKYMSMANGGTVQSNPSRTMIQRPSRFEAVFGDTSILPGLREASILFDWLLMMCSSTRQTACRSFSATDGGFVRTRFQKAGTLQRLHRKTLVILQSIISWFKKLQSLPCARIQSA
jgi:hypothetical protein